MEKIQLLSTVYENIAGFSGYIVRDTSDPTNHTAFGFPGMQFGVVVNLPNG